MGRSKTNQSDGSSIVESRQRVTKACQRCRLKKCKCDGHSPCSRCRADDVICAYVKHQQFEKIVYRKGYVQMLERQQTQLIAGIQSFYTMVHKGQSLSTEPLESNGRGQPLVHQILQRLGVLQENDPWDEVDPEEVGCDSPPTELDSAVSTNIDTENRTLWPNDIEAHSIAGAPLASTHAWTTSSVASSMLLPWATAPCQYLDVQQTASRSPASCVAAGFVSGDDSPTSYVEAKSSQISTGPSIYSTLNHPPTYSGQYLNAARDQSAPPALNWPLMWDEPSGIMGDDGEQHRYI